MNEENQKIMDILTNVRIDIARLEGKVDVIKDLQHKVDIIESTAVEALQSAKSAIERLNALDSDITDRFKNINKIFFWVATTIISGLLLGAIGLLYEYAKRS